MCSASNLILKTETAIYYQYSMIGFEQSSYSEKCTLYIVIDNEKHFVRKYRDVLSASSVIEMIYTLNRNESAKSFFIPTQEMLDKK